MSWIPVVKLKLLKGAGLVSKGAIDKRTFQVTVDRSFKTLDGSRDFEVTVDKSFKVPKKRIIKHA